MEMHYIAGHLECMQSLLEAGSDVSKLCEGSPPLHMAVCVGALPHKESFAEATVRMLLKHGAVPYERYTLTCFFVPDVHLSLSGCCLIM